MGERKRKLSLINGGKKEMKVNFSVVIKTIFGKPMQGEPIVAEDGRITGWNDCHLGDVALQGLFANKADEGATGQQKLERHRIAEKVANSLETKSAVDLKVEEVSLIKELIGKHVNASAVGAAWDEIERQGKIKEEAPAQPEPQPEVAK